MKCSECGGLVEWRGRFSNLTHTECLSCGAINSELPEDDITNITYHIKPLPEKEMKLKDILTDVYQSSIGVEEAERLIKAHLDYILESASFGISSLDATEMNAEINSKLDDFYSEGE